MKIEKRKLETLKPYANNAKEHPEWQIEQIKESIKRFGFNDPIAIDEQGNIIEGHGRYLASIQLELKEVDCIVLGHLTELEKKAYIIAHNKLTINTGFDLAILEEELSNLKENKIDLVITGFSEYELETLLSSNELELDEVLSDDEKSKQEEKRCPHCGGIL
ncbi:ParB/Srx family N-terminal domain-containing protein [Fusobacterium necrophorum]|uniref:ParB/Srx family N-terminal domain-containing protein n=1 Tax=Fusobacterium necrophorum TaxID=859 RepID=UPI00370E42C5